MGGDLLLAVWLDGLYLVIVTVMKFDPSGIV
jgi:hypothetical protein